MCSKLNIINLIFFISLLCHQHNLNYSVWSFILLCIFFPFFHFSCFSLPFFGAFYPVRAVFFWELRNVNSKVWKKERACQRKTWTGTNAGRMTAAKEQKSDGGSNSRRVRGRRRGVAGGFLVWVRNLPLCQPRLDIKWWQCDRNYLLTLLLKPCGLRFGDGRRGRELDERLGKKGLEVLLLWRVGGKGKRYQGG